MAFKKIKLSSIIQSRSMSVCLSVRLSICLKLKISVTTEPNGFYSSWNLLTGLLEAKGEAASIGQFITFLIKEIL